MSILCECPLCHKKQSIRNKACKCGADLDKMKRQKDKIKYWIQFYVKEKQHRESVGYSLEEAKDADSKRRVQVKENRYLDIRQDAKLTFNDLSKWYLELDSTKALASYRVISLRLSRFNGKFSDTLLSDLKKTDIEGFQANLKGEGLSHAYIDNIVTQAHVMVKAAYSDDIVSLEALKPFIITKQTLKKNSNARNRILSFDEFKRLTAATPDHLRGIIAMGYFTGMRKSEILGLTWNRVALEKREIRLEAMDTKTGEPRACPIGGELLKILQGLPSRLKSPYVFTYKGEPLKDIKKSLQGACRLAGIPYGRRMKNGLTFHDIRHTFNTCARKAGIAESVIMAITGHETREMFDRYNKVDSEDTRQAIDRIEAFLVNT